jgi:hypothetical protein
MVWCVIKPMDNIAFTLSLSKWGYQQQLYALWRCHAYILSPLCMQYEIFIVLWFTNMQSILLLVNHIGLSQSKLFIEVSSGTCWPRAGNIAGGWLECGLATVHWSDICMLWASLESAMYRMNSLSTSFSEAYRKNLQFCLVRVNMQGVLGGKVNFWEVIVSVIPSKKVYMYMCPIPNSDLY